MKTVRMYTRLPLKTIYALVKKIKIWRNIFTLRRGSKFNLTREHLSWFRGLLDIEKYKRWTIKELRDYFLERFRLPDDFITESGLRRSLKKKNKIKLEKNFLLQKKINRNKII